jgi:hypothetical protein
MLFISPANKGNSTMQMVAIRNSPTVFFCPVTGQQIIGDSESKPSEATLFVYVPEAVDPVYCDDNYKHLFEGDPLDISDRLTDALQDKDVVVFHLLGQFPGDAAVYIGVDFQKGPIEDE